MDVEVCVALSALGGLGRSISCLDASTARLPKVRDCELEIPCFCTACLNIVPDADIDKSSKARSGDALRGEVKVALADSRATV